MVLCLTLGGICISGASVNAQSAPPPVASESPGRHAVTAAEDAPADSVMHEPVDDELEFPVPLGSFTTTLHGSLAARTVNVRLAATALDGAIIEPGEVLSFNQRVGPRTVGRGYQPAPVILHETRQVQTGGGVCQVASTVFIAGLLSGLGVSERWRHSSPVDYIALGEDATIAWGAKDLKLRNDTGQRLRLRVSVIGAALSAHFEGVESLAEEFDLAREEREVPGDDDSGAPGHEVTLLRIRRSNGEESRELVHRDVIPAQRSRESR